MPDNALSEVYGIQQELQALVACGTLRRSSRQQLETSRWRARRMRRRRIRALLEAGSTRSACGCSRSTGAKRSSS
jgi:hypothetical protein